MRLRDHRLRQQQLQQRDGLSAERLRRRRFQFGLWAPQQRSGRAGNNTAIGACAGGFGAAAAGAQATAIGANAQTTQRGAVAVGAVASGDLATAIGFNVQATCNETGNYTVLRDLSAPGFCDANTAARSGEIFAGQRASRLDLSGVVALDPQLTLLPQIEGNGLLHRAGFFSLVPAQVDFTLLSAPVDGRWRVFGVVAHVGSSTPAAPAPPAPPQPQGAPPAPASKTETAKPAANPVRPRASDEWKQRQDGCAARKPTRQSLSDMASA